jgi:hypothetical protein
MRFRIAMAALFAGAALVIVSTLTRRAEAVESKSPAADPGAAIVRLEARLKELEARVPNQAVVMTHDAYHFANLWVAAGHRNWPLADFYLGEVRDNLKWAVRVHPVREGPAGEVNVAGIAESVDNTQLNALEEAIRRRQPKEFRRAYDETLTACAACHAAVGKPYLRPHRPASPEVQAIDFDRAAK